MNTSCAVSIPLSLWLRKQEASESPIVPWALAVWARVLESRKDKEGRGWSHRSQDLCRAHSSNTVFQLVGSQIANGPGTSQILLGIKEEHYLRIWNSRVGSASHWLWALSLYDGPQGWLNIRIAWRTLKNTDIWTLPQVILT